MNVRAAISPTRLSSSRLAIVQLPSTKLGNKIVLWRQARQQRRSVDQTRLTSILITILARLRVVS